MTEYSQKFNPNALYLDKTAFENSRIVTCDPCTLNANDCDSILCGSKPNLLSLATLLAISSPFFSVSIVSQYSNADGTINEYAQNAPWHNSLVICGFDKFYFFDAHNMPTPQNLYDLLNPILAAHNSDKMGFFDGNSAHSFTNGNLYQYMGVFMRNGIYIRHSLSPI